MFVRCRLTVRSSTSTEATMIATTQTEFADRLRADQQSWRQLVAAVGRDRLEEPGPMGDWSFRDLAGHLLGWRNRTIARLEAAARDQPEPAPRWPAELDDDDVINNWIREHDRDRSTQELVDGYDASYDRLAAAVEALSPDHFERPGAFGWLEGEALRDVDPTSHF